VQYIRSGLPATGHAVAVTGRLQIYF